MNWLMGNNSENATFKKIRNLLSFRVTRPELAKKKKIPWCWLFALCFNSILTFEQCQSYTWDHRSTTEQMVTTPAESFASVKGTSKTRWSQQPVQSKGHTRAKPLRSLGLLRSFVCIKTGWREMHTGLFFLTPMFSVNTFFLSHN